MSFLCWEKKRKTLTPTKGVTKKKGKGRLLFFLWPSPCNRAARDLFLEKSREVT